MARDATIGDGRVLVVGLGNPGLRYARTRHNIGADVAAAFAEQHGIALSEQRFKGRLGSGLACGRMVTVLLPETFMNRSGLSVSPALQFWKRTPGHLIVAHDELDLPLGRVRLKLGGGHGGHNGLRSIDTELPSREYFRVRLGIDRPPAGGDVSNWVLGHFTGGEQGGVDHLMERGIAAIEGVIAEGLLATQNRIHPLA